MMAILSIENMDAFEHRVVRIPESGCWLWDSYCDPGGYGRFKIGHKHFSAHRFSYEKHRGPIPHGLHLDHLCRVRCCVNPFHLEPVTLQENLRRGIGPEISKERFRSQTHCKNGHEFTPENTVMRLDGKYKKYMQRCCMECNRLRAIKHRQKNGAKVGAFGADHVRRIKESWTARRAPKVPV